MKNLLILDDSAVSTAIRSRLNNCDILSDFKRIKEVNSRYNGLVISHHDFSYDKELSVKELGAWYSRDVVQFGQVLEQSRRLLQPGGKVIAIISMDYILGSFASKHYNAIHAARQSLIKSYGNMLAEQNLSVNGVALGWIDDVLETETVEKTDSIKQLASDNNPYQRMGQPGEVAEMISTLLGLQTNFLNGHTINFDGGQVNADPVNRLENLLLD